MAEISQVQLPSGSQYSIRDRAAMHYLGVSTTAISEGAAAAPVTIVVEGITYTTDDTVTIDNTHKRLHCYDYVIYNDESFLFLVTVVNNTESYAWKKITNALNLDVQIDNTSIISNDIADIITTGSSSGGTAYDPSTNPITTKDYVDNAISGAIQDLPEPMIFSGGVTVVETVTGTSPNYTYSYSVTLPNDITTLSEGYTFKVTSASGSYPGDYDGEKVTVGDTFIVTTAGTISSHVTTDTVWTIIPSGDEPSGTVTSVGVARDGSNNPKGLKTDQTNSGPIISSGTLSLDFASGFDTKSSVASSARSSTANREYGLELDSNSKLAVNVPWTDTTYTATNGIKIESGVIQHTNSITAQSNQHVKRVTFDDQGHITGATNAATATIKNPTKKTVVTDMSVEEPSSTAVTGELAYYSVSNETLILKKIVETTGDSITTTNVTNVVRDVDAT